MATEEARARWHSPALLPALALAALLAYNVALTPHFARLEIRDGRVFGAMIDVLRNGAPVMLLATGMTLVIATGGIDLSVGSVMALAGAVAALLAVKGVAVFEAMAAGIGAGMIVGCVNGVLVTAVGLQPIVATLIMLVAGRGLAQTLTHDQKIRFEIPALEYMGTGSVLGLPFPIFLVAGLVVMTGLAIRKTVLGLYVEAVGGNFRAARLCGLPVHAIRVVVYVFCAICAGLAGLVAAGTIKEADVANCGLYLELDTILAVVIGGTPLAGGRPHLAGSLIGALIMQVLTSMLQMRGVITEHTLIVKAVAVVAVCFLQTPVFSSLLQRVRRRAVAA